MWERWHVRPTTLEAAGELAAEFLKYDADVIQSRRHRVCEFTRELSDCPVPSECTQFKEALQKAFGRFTQPTRSGRPMHECPEGRSHAFNSALMDMALAGWRSPYMFMTLQTVRDACLRMQTVDIMEIKAMAFCFLAFGTQLSDIQGGVVAAVVAVE